MNENPALVCNIKAKSPKTPFLDDLKGGHTLCISVDTYTSSFAAVIETPDEHKHMQRDRMHHISVKCMKPTHSLSTDPCH